MLHAGLDLSRRKIDICLLSAGGQLDQLVTPPDGDALRSLAGRIDEQYGEPVCAVIESMTGARLVHDTLERGGWDVEIADAQRVKGMAPLACKTDKIDSRVLADGELVRRQDRLPSSVSALGSSLSINAGTTGPLSTGRPTLVLLAACSSSADASASA